MADMNNNRTSTSTQIRNYYSEGISCLNIKFYNANLSFSLYPFSGNNQNGRAQYDSRNAQQTTVNYEGAYALYQIAKDIIDEKVKETNIVIPCKEATITVERKTNMNGSMDTIFSITKNNVTIPFKFSTIQYQVKDNNGQIQTKTVETGLGAFMKTIEGYLNGINADRHLDKLTNDYAKLQDGNAGQGPQPQYQNQGRQQYNNGGGNGQYRPRNNYKRPSYNNNGNNNYNNNRSQPLQQNNWGGPGQNLSDYQLPQN